MDPDIYTLKQAIMKIDSFIQDICELKDDDSDNRDTLEIVAATASTIEARLINIYKIKTGDEELIYDIEMEELEKFPFDIDDEVDNLDDDIIL